MDDRMNEKQYSLLVLKPDTLRQVLDVNIICDLEDRGFEIVKRKMVKFTPEQAGELYDEKKDYNYFPLLKEFMSSGQSICLILRSDKAIEKSKEYRDWARQNLKLKRFELTNEDVKLLSEGTHPQQTEITREMALENLIHVSDSFEADIPLIREIFTRWDQDELKGREPELYQALFGERKAEPRSLTTYHPSPEIY